MHGHLLQDIGLCVVAATALAYLARWARQPLLLAYIAAGVLIGPVGFAFISDAGSIQTLAELGLAFLLFLVGLEINLRKLLESGRVASVATVVQVTGSVALAWGAALLLGYSGLPAVYLGIAAAFSSTMIVVKHLSDRSELDTLPGRVILAILLAQDALAVVVLAIQPSLGGGGEGSLLAGLSLSVLKGLALVVGTIVAGRTALPLLLRSVAKSPEVLLISAVSWCFLVCWAAMEAGFSSAVGALLAGVTISSLPYSLEVVAKIRSLRDFFVTLFFVSLGMLLPVPTPRLLAAAAVLSLAVVASRFLILPPALRLLGFDNRVGLVSAIHLSQISEFALVILLLGVSERYRHIPPEIVSVGVMTLVITATLSTYLVRASHPLVRVLVRWTGGTVLADPQAGAGEGRRPGAPIVLVGCFRAGWSLVRGLVAAEREFLVIDFNPETHRELQRMGVRCVYGDISHLDTLEHAGVDEAEVLISSIPDDFLRETSNRKLLETLRRLNPSARIVMTAESVPGAMELYAAGADYVLVPPALAAETILEVLGRAEERGWERIREEAREGLRGTGGAVTRPAGPRWDRGGPPGGPEEPR
jgi:Kef-type K+ transport system membrane component KefB